MREKPIRQFDCYFLWFAVLPKSNQTVCLLSSSSSIESLKFSSNHKDEIIIMFFFTVLWSLCATPFCESPTKYKKKPHTKANGVVWNRKNSNAVRERRITHRHPSPINDANPCDAKYIHGTQYMQGFFVLIRHAQALSAHDGLRIAQNCTRVSRVRRTYCSPMEGVFVRAYGFECKVDRQARNVCSILDANEEAARCS